jgi:hypothetical protein
MLRMVGVGSKFLRVTTCGEDWRFVLCGWWCYLGVPLNVG